MKAPKLDVRKLEDLNSFGAGAVLSAGSVRALNNGLQHGYAPSIWTVMQM